MKKTLIALLVCFSLVFSISALAQTRKVDICHSDGKGFFHKINISRNALPAHIAHGDAIPGDAVPGLSGYEFDSDCQAVLAQPNFVPFFIRNNNNVLCVSYYPNPAGCARINAPWDYDLVITENADGDGFLALTPRGGQKVGYGTNFFDNIPVSSIQSVSWEKLAGKAGLVAYLNIWVTDGTRYAVIASENDYRGTDFSTRQEWKVFEYDTTAGLNWLCPTGTIGGVSSQYLTCNGTKATLADIPDNVKILSPNMTTPPPYITTGAPRGGFGFNLIWGDTQLNFTNYDGISLKTLCIRVNEIDYCAVD